MNREILAYATTHIGKIFVIKLDRNGIPQTQSAVYQDIQLLRGLGVKVVICYPERRLFAPECRVFDYKEVAPNKLRIAFRTRHDIPLVICNDRETAQLANTLHARKLIYLVDSVGVLDENGNLIRQISKLQSVDLLEKKKVDQKELVTGTMRDKILAAIWALDHQVERVHIAAKESLIDELFSCSGSGTMICAQMGSYNQSREARPSDIAKINTLIKRSDFEGNLLKIIESSISSFVVFEVDIALYGCALCVIKDNAMHVDFFVANDIQNFDVVSELLLYILSKAKNCGCTKVIITDRNQLSLFCHPMIYQAGFCNNKADKSRSWTFDFPTNPL